MLQESDALNCTSLLASLLVGQLMEAVRVAETRRPCPDTPPCAEHSTTGVCTAVDKEAA